MQENGAVSPKPNQKPYQVLSAPLKSKCTLFIASNTASDMSVRAIKSGAVEFLPKPFSDEALLWAVEQALAGAQQTWKA